MHALTHGSHPVRRHAASSVRKVISVLGGAKVALGLLKQFHAMLQSTKVGADLLVIYVRLKYSLY